MVIVQKFGGTSVRDPEVMKIAARHVVREVNKGNKVAVVVSAMAGETDRLLKFVKSVSPRFYEYLDEVDAAISTGEQFSAAVFSIILRDMGLKSKSYNAFQAKIFSDEIFSNSRILYIEPDEIISDLENGIVPVVTGFQAITLSGRITTLGRGGSDTTAVALAASLSAEICEIYTDVPGVFTADPSIVSSAKKIRYISYEEMMEMASLGAKVLHIKSVEIAALHKVKILVRSTFSDEDGTYVLPEEEVMQLMRKEIKSRIVSAVTLDKNQSKITFIGVPDRPGIAASIFTPLGKGGISVDMIVQNVSTEGLTDLTFTVSRNDFEKALKISQDVAKDLGFKGLTFKEKIAKVSIIGIGMMNEPGVSARMFSTLAKNNINIEMISTSEIKISCVIDEKFGELALRVLHEEFLEKE